MDPTTAKGLHDKFYEKRKAAALDLEKQVRDCHYNNEQARIEAILDQVIELFANVSHPLHVRNGGLIALAAIGIALGTDIAPYMERFVNPLLVCFSDTESRIRYFAAESLYNIAKVSRGEILIYFNPIFDALSKLSADSELSVKNGAELLDRLLKDTVAECATIYVAQHPQSEAARRRVEEAYGLGILVNYPDEDDLANEKQGVKKAFSLANFIPLLADRIYVLSPFTRSFLISWIAVLDSIPDLEMVSYLPHFLDGLLKYLSDPTEEVRTAAENLLADFLREIRDIAVVEKKRQERLAARRLAKRLEQDRFAAMNLSLNGKPVDTEKSSDTGSLSTAVEGAGLSGSPFQEKQELDIVDERDTGAWIPGQGVKVDHAAIIEILINQLDGEHDEIQQSIALKWIYEFLTFAQDVVVPFTPRLIPAILPNLAHHVSDIQAAAIKANQLLFNVIQGLPPSASGQPAAQSAIGLQKGASITVSSPNRTGIPIPIAAAAGGMLVSASPPSSSPLAARTASQPDMQDNGPASNKLRTMPVIMDQPGSSNSSFVEEKPGTPAVSDVPLPDPERKPTLPATDEGESDPFDYHATVSALTIRFLDEHEETRVAGLKWLIMLHQKVPGKILAMDDGTFPALLKNLSDPSEEVIKYDLQLLSQISTNSDEGYFKSFMLNLLGLFSTDKRLLETRGSLIIRQLCLSLNTERIYRTLAEILEKEEDLAFASNMVQKLNLILITAPELAEFRKRLKTLETRQDGQALFITLYRSWCHNAVAAFSLCLLAQAYEHASNLLQIFAELEITVHLLVQIDKLVQLIESPVFTYLRLQLLEPEKYPFLYKCLYGLLMLLPQSPAFISLRNRLNAVSSLGFLHIAPKPSQQTVPVNVVSSSRSKLGRDDIKWQELFAHFRSVQTKHEKARRVGLGGSAGPLLDGYSTTTTQGGGQAGRPSQRRRATGDALPPVGHGANAQIPARGTGALSPLNPRARAGTGSGIMGALAGSGVSRPMSPSSMLSQPRNKANLSMTRK
ncbi:hypothetical protein FRC18_010555 [Serendipita sp. 400]|nr:hypothetical protein FRC18_010555 [Serendipita sp. 400]